MTATTDETTSPDAGGDHPAPGPVDPVGPDVEAARPDAGSATTRPRTVRRALTVAFALATLAAVVLAVLWVLTLTSLSLALARDRDAVLVDAKQAAINLNTLDYRNVDAGLDLWQQSSTGAVLAEFQQNRDQYAKLVQDSKRTTVATVPDAAVTELDEHAGVARVLVAVDVTVTPEGQPAAVTRQRLQMEMTRTPDGWKVSKLSPVRSPTTGG